MVCQLTQGLTKAWQCPRAWNVFLSHSYTINLATSVNESSLKEIDCESSDKIFGTKEWCISSTRAHWLVAVCHSHLGDTLIVLNRPSCRRTETTESTRRVCRNTNVASWPTCTSRSSTFRGATPSPSSSTPSSSPSFSSPSSGGSWGTTTATLTTSATPTTRLVSWAFRASLAPYSSPSRPRRL